MVSRRWRLPELKTRHYHSRSGLACLDGLDVTRALRKESSVPIIMLTARNEETDKLVGLELGRTITSPSHSHRKNWFAAHRSATI
jgi:CheY-like chemotaxis protein